MPQHTFTLSVDDAALFERFQIMDNSERLAEAKELTDRILTTGRLAEDFKAVERKPHVASGRRENDAEHSWHLGLTAVDLAADFYPQLNIERVRAFSAVHDLIETEVGDVSTFDLTPAQIAAKERLEEESMQRLLDRTYGVTKTDIEAYEAQDSKEARFVRMVDKVLPITVTLTSDNMRSLADYGVTSLETLKEKHNAIHERLDEKFGEEFPEIVATHAVLCYLLEERFAAEDCVQVTAEDAERSPVEIEHKYLIDLASLPNFVSLTDPSIERELLKQGYIGLGDDGSEARIRSFNNERFELTVKQPGHTERKEDTIRGISYELFQDLWGKTEGRRIEKIRYTIPSGKWKIELDVYQGNLQGLATAEVEFSKKDWLADARLEASTFEPPEWFGENISEDPRYKNYTLSIYGIPR